MHIPLASLAFLLLHPGPSISHIVPQIPLSCSPTTEASYGYVGPGVYRIVSYVNEYAVSSNKSQPATRLVAMPPTTNDDDQRWLIADVSATEKLIINNGTGAFLSERPNLYTYAVSTPPFDPQARWTIDFDRYSDYSGSPVMLINVTPRDHVHVLDLYNNEMKAGTPILSYPMNSTKSKNQAWLLEYLGPSLPGPCDFPEADQKALRGNVVDECDNWAYVHMTTGNAKECWKRVRDLKDVFKLESYVFTSNVEPGSPDGQGSPGDCYGYQARSYRFFVGSSTGSGFGGDLALPFS